jgi:hypothetical protein
VLEVWSMRRLDPHGEVRHLVDLFLAVLGSTLLVHPITACPDAQVGESKQFWPTAPSQCEGAAPQVWRGQRSEQLHMERTCVSPLVACQQHGAARQPPSARHRR